MTTTAATTTAAARIYDDFDAQARRQSGRQQCIAGTCGQWNASCVHCHREAKSLMALAAKSILAASPPTADELALFDDSAVDGATRYQVARGIVGDWAGAVVDQVMDTAAAFCA